MTLLERFRTRRVEEAGAPVAAVDGPLFDEELLARLRRLSVVSRQTLAQGLAGEHRSRRRGASPEFADFKSYSPGDDFRQIDWNLYARLDSLFVRLSEVTTELPVHILLDASSSMDWRGDARTPAKFRMARQLAGAIGYVSLWHFDRVTISPFGATLGQPFGPVQGRSRLSPMLSFLTDCPILGETAISDILATYLHAHRNPGLLLLVSDLLSGEPEGLASSFRDLRARGWQVAVLHIVDDAEIDPGPLFDDGQTGPVDLLDVELGERLVITPTVAVLDRYREAVSDWMLEIEAACEAERIDYVRLSTTMPVDQVVLTLLHERGLIE